MRAATLCFLVDGTRIAFAEMLRGPFKGRLNGHGGEIEEADITTATIREVREECGVVIAREDVLPAAVIDFHNWKHGE